jgi:hypothetical protein
MIGPEAFSAEWDAGLTASPDEELDGAISDPTPRHATSLMQREE